MGAARNRQAEIERKIRKAQRFYYLCKLLTGYTEHQIIRFMQVRGLTK